MHDDLVGAGISPKERLERIEALLARIDEKLDGKANLHDLYALQLRMEVIEKEFAEHKVWATQLLNQLPALEDGINSLKTRMAYGAGAAALAIIIAEKFITKVGF